jgi:predicted transcriptional regulator
MKCDTVLNIRLPDDVKNALKAASERETRSMSGMALHLIREWLLANDYLPPPPPAPKATTRRR